DLQDAVALVCKQVVGGHDVIECVLVSDQHTEIKPFGSQHVHQAAHAFLATRAQCRIDAVIAQACRKCVCRNGQIGGIHTEARERATGFENTQARLERALRAQRFNGRIHAAPAGEFHDLVNDIAVVEVQGDVCTHYFGDAQTVVV